MERTRGDAHGTVANKLRRSDHRLPRSHCGRSSQVVPNGSTLHRSASNSLLARTADRTPKTFALQGDPSRPTHYPSSKRSPYIVFPAGRDVTWNDLAHSWRIFSPNRDIEKIPAPLRSYISLPKSPNLSASRQICRQVAKFVAKMVTKVRGPDLSTVRHLILTPVKLSSQP
ncbi:hypothetical protein AVEN_99231-1 [Araneus ventricosus]|uniref:Uncharacterized protein n=1 Tax=Araneus ventricosus TaxID=182803 RepID=A0A4Y2RNB4_ARAVE|nr:hypothetical protein AVEN_99231-1 [Araneus ventricosus]